MVGNSKIPKIAAVILIAFILQIVLILADRHESPGKAAVDFSKAYFKLSTDIREHLCSEITEDEESDIIDDYLARVADQARSEGFDVSWMRMALSHIETEIQMMEDNVAEVRISGTRRRAVNPVFALVAKIFSLGETHHIEETLTLVKENNRWKVCGEPFGLVGG
ncbi:MAG: hypothetical protein PVH42_10065 [Desulfobacterales bacterium]|jgi:hypothetical protein